ncbi:MAG: DUF4831 family protein, partial [Bacteroidota bacterium]|nr:DUF4831 family protein [Bacteroidota bacterium]
IIVIVLMIFVLVSCQKSWYVVSDKDAEDKHRAEGIMYSLPRTVLDVDITLNVYDYTPGPFSQYANSYLNISGVEQQEMSFWEIDAVKIYENPEPDPDAKFWLVPRKTRPSIQLTDQGTLTGINNFQVIENLPVVGRFYPVRKTLPNDILFTNLGVKRNKYEVIDTTWRVIEKDSVISRIPVYKSVEKEKTWHHKAQDAANFIIKIRKRIFKLEAAIEEQQADGEGIGIMIEKLEALEREYVELFIGKTEVETRYYHFKIVPESGNSSQIFFLANLDIETGDFVEDEPQAHTIKLKVEAAELYSSKQPSPEKVTDIGLVSRQSVMANCYLLLNEEIVYEKSAMIPQIGVFKTLSSDLISDDTKILINPKTGSLQMIE